MPAILFFAGTNNAFAQTTAPPSLSPATVGFIKQGDSALSARHFEDAIKTYKKANKLEHDACEPCWVGLALGDEALRNMDSALKDSAKAISSSSTDAERADAHGVRGDLFVRESKNGNKYDAKKLTEAESEYRTALTLQPSGSEYHMRLAIALFKESRDDEGRAEIAAYLKASPDGRYASYAKTLDANPRRAREDYAPDFMVTTLQGQTLSLSSFAGRYLVLDFWATWCPPCRASVGELKDLTRRYPADRVVLLSISGDKDEQQWRQFIAQKGMDWQQARDLDHKMGKLFAVYAIPTYIVIDPEGIIRERIMDKDPRLSVVARLKTALQALPPASNGKG